MPSSSVCEKQSVPITTLSKLVIPPRPTPQHSSALLFRLPPHFSSSIPDYHLPSVNHSILFNAQHQSVLGILYPAMDTRIPQRAPLLLIQHPSLFVQRKLVDHLSVHFLPAQLQNTLAEQTTSPTLHFSHQLLIAMFSLIGDDFNLLAVDRLLHRVFDEVILHHYISFQLVS